MFPGRPCGINRFDRESRVHAWIETGGMLFFKRELVTIRLSIGLEQRTRVDRFEMRRIGSVMIVTLIKTGELGKPYPKDEDEGAYRR